MNDFVVGNKTHVLDPLVRGWVKPGWEEMLLPAKDRLGKNIPIAESAQAVLHAENNLYLHNKTLVGKQVLEIGCNEGVRSFITAKYQDTYVLGIDIDEYTVAQSPDMNLWNPNDVQFVNNKFKSVREELYRKFPSSVGGKVQFETGDISTFTTDRIFDIVISWDTIEHILDLPKAFNRMYECLKPGGLSYHEYNPFFAINGGHSLCTLDFLYGHCRLSAEDFKRYIREYRPGEEKIATNFFEKCLNRVTITDVKKYAKDAGFEILLCEGKVAFSDKIDMWRSRIEDEFLPDVVELYPTATPEDLLYGGVYLLLRKI